MRVEFPNPDELILPGQFVNVTLVSAKPENQIVVPQTAIQENQTGPFVLVVDKDNKVGIRPVKTGQRKGTEISVTEGPVELKSPAVAPSISERVSPIESASAHKFDSLDMSVSAREYP